MEKSLIRMFLKVFTGFDSPVKRSSDPPSNPLIARKAGDRFFVVDAVL